MEIDKEEKCSCGGLWFYSNFLKTLTRKCRSCNKKQIFLKDPKDFYNGGWVNEGKN